MTEDTLPRIGDVYRIVKDVDNKFAPLDEPVLVDVELVTKRGRGYQVHTKFGRFRLRDFIKATEYVE
jgi:hypothetical protein